MENVIACGCPNTLFVVAAGNDGTDNGKIPHYPCNYGAPPDNLPNVICVAATDQNDVLASFSNYGATSVDLAAPGVAVTSTWPAYDTLYTQGFEDPFTAWTLTGAFGRSPLHANGAFSMSDSPGGNYVPGVTHARAPAPVASFSGRIGCQAAYNLRFDSTVLRRLQRRGAVERRLRQLLLVGLVGLVARIVPGAHVRLLRARQRRRRSRSA